MYQSDPGWYFFFLRFVHPIQFLEKIGFEAVFLDWKL